MLKNSMKGEAVVIQYRQLLVTNSERQNPMSGKGMK
jgi:hypothetical protein